MTAVRCSRSFDNVIHPSIASSVGITTSSVGMGMSVGILVGMSVGILVGMLVGISVPPSSGHTPEKQITPYYIAVKSLL